MRSRSRVSRYGPTGLGLRASAKAISPCVVLDDVVVASEKNDGGADSAVSPAGGPPAIVRVRFAELHGRLVAGELVVAEELCALLAPELRRSLRARNPRIAPELIEEAIDDTLTALIRAPARCDPARGDSMAWLVTIARNKLLDSIRAMARLREVPLTEDLERVLQAPVGTSSDDLAARDAWIETHRRRILAVAKTEPERRFLEARLRGASLAEQASALGAQDLPEAEQRALVNRMWERLRLRLRRSLLSRQIP
jgi:DNA-directed RNA polymerase specialized sigma24 family protein